MLLRSVDFGLEDLRGFRLGLLLAVARSSDHIACIWPAVVLILTEDVEHSLGLLRIWQQLRVMQERLLIPASRSCNRPIDDWHNLRDCLFLDKREKALVLCGIDLCNICKSPGADGAQIARGEHAQDEDDFGGHI